MNANILSKLTILAESAKYDASCASSGSARAGVPGGIGSARPSGICHAFTEDGRCLSLLKVLFSNACIYDCAYCVNRVGNDLPRTTFTPQELTTLTIEFYRRNYIEGLFLSSAVVKSADYTMERMIRAVKDLRKEHRFNGYIHMKAIPGASAELVRQAGLYADRLSVNIEIPSEKNLKYLAPEKNYRSVYAPMSYIKKEALQNREDKKRLRSTPSFAPAGQSTQMIVGASNERDRDILLLSSLLYKGPQLRRVYYSAFVPVNGNDPRLPAVPMLSGRQTQPGGTAQTHLPALSQGKGKKKRAVPLQQVREHRLYQADWLMRLYSFDAEEILDSTQPDLDLEIDPKLMWALRHPQLFPLDVNRADYFELLRVPGIGLISAQRIVAARRQRKLSEENLVKLGVVMKRARYFIAPSTPSVTNGAAPAQLVSQTIQEKGPAAVRAMILAAEHPPQSYQYSLFSAAQ